MRLSPNANPNLRSGRLLRRAFLGLFLLGVVATAQTAKPPPKKVATPTRANELTLAGLRPGVDPVSRAIARYKKPVDGKSGETSFSWVDECRNSSLFLDTTPSGNIQTIRVSSHVEFKIVDCKDLPPGPWKTGRGLRVWDEAKLVTKLYGEPDSRSPSSKGGQPLELWYYAFDWAGPDVPQVMEVLCTREKDGNPGHVIEITLAAPSL